MTIFNKAKLNTFTVIANVLTMVAVFFVNVASPAFIYSCDTPEELLK